MSDNVVLELTKDEADLLYDLMNKLNKGDDYYSEIGGNLIYRSSDKISLDYIEHKLRNAMNNIKKDSDLNNALKFAGSARTI